MNFEVVWYPNIKKRKMGEIDNVFLQHCAEVLAATDSPLSGAKIAKIMNAYSIDYGVQIPDSVTISQEPNKRSLLFDYLKCFPGEQQYCIIYSLCDSDIFDNYEKYDSIKQMKETLIERYGKSNQQPAANKNVMKQNEVMANLQTIRETHIEKTVENSLRIVKIKSKVFISHSSKDADIIKYFKTHILIAGLGLTDDDIVCTSFEETGIAVGANIPQYIEDNIANAKIVLCMISQNYKRSEICQNEVGAAWALKKEIIQVVLPDCTFDNVGWLLNLDKAMKIEKAASLDNFQEKMCNILGLPMKSAKQWNPHKEDFLMPLRTLLDGAKEGAKKEQATVGLNEEKSFDKRQFMCIDKRWTEQEVVAIVENIIRLQKFNDYQADFLDDLESHNKYEKNHFIDEDLQSCFDTLCVSISKFMLFLSQYCSPSKVSWNVESMAGKSEAEIKEIKSQRFYVWHENHDLPDKLYDERYKIMCTELPQLGNAVISAYKDFRKNIKCKLYL